MLLPAAQVLDMWLCVVWLVQGDAQLFAIPQPQPCNHKQQQHQPQQGPAQHSMLGFSFPSAGASSVMSLEGETFRQLQPSGLDHAEASLLLTTAPGGWMLQVTGIMLSVHRRDVGLAEAGVENDAYM